MKTLTAILYLLFYLSQFTFSAFRVQEVLVGQTATLQFNMVCDEEDAEVTRFIPDQTRIGGCVNGTCTVEDKFQKRLELAGNVKTGNISLLIRSAVYNDFGSYECKCGGNTTEIKLKGFFPTVVTARELENVSLPCHGDTRRDARDVEWKKDGQRVVHYNRETDSVSYGRDFKDRFKMTPEGFEDGNLTLLITSVHASDAGLYQCTIHDESREGEPPAVLLKMEENKMDGCLKGKGMDTKVIGVAIAVAIMVFIVGVVMGVAIGPKLKAAYIWRRNRRSNHPVQEMSTISSETEQLKPSLTRPYQD
ncbi:uncharacterized protein LOC143503277 [Brachyhypopomus gauderio]|uniref:uncharacterized protein LOC143503277 n=1 Tax=Brachyhypopomus gauderio TaxID=698409 RepID=UPI004041FCE6